MSKNIDKVKVQIPGTMYYLQLAEDRGRWILSLQLRGDIESEVTVPVFSKNGINKAANELLNNSRLVIDKYPLRNVCDQLYAQAESSLPTHQPPAQVDEVADDEEFDEIKQKIDLLENTLDNTEEELKENLETLNERLTALENERVTRLETELDKDEPKKFQEMFTQIFDRLDRIEETLAQTKGDHRVPSLITAVDALESKLKYLEGTAITSDSAPIQEGEYIDIENLKVELSKLSKAFDSVNIRLTEIENKIRTITPSPAPIEGIPPTAPVAPTAPTTDHDLTKE
ncbi:MAG: hypothetical protein ACFFDW_16090 [Candidatus Thorarchaeota archaeon]